MAKFGKANNVIPPLSKINRLLNNELVSKIRPEAW